MAGLFSALGKILRGQPVFDEQPSRDEEANGMQSSDVPAASQPKTPPLVTIVRVEYNELGNNQMSLNFHIQNQSDQVVELCRLELIGHSKGLGDTLRQGESKEITEVYRGPMLPNTSDRHAELEYKVAGGDYFKTIHRLGYNYEANNIFGVNAVYYEPPIRRS